MSTEPASAVSTHSLYHTVTPYLIVPGVSAVIAFAERAFGAEETQRHARPDGSIAHAEMRIGDTIVMLGEPTDEWAAMPASLNLFTDEVDATYARALEAGATSLRAPEDQPYGRSAGVRDASGNHWWMSTPFKES